MSVGVAPVPLRLIDADFVAGAASGDEPYVARIQGSLERAGVDIEVISDPHIDLPDRFSGEEEDAERTLAEAFLSRYAALRAPFGGAAPHLVVVRGQRRIEAPPSAQPLDQGRAERVWELAFSRLAAPPEAPLLVLADDEAPPGGVAAVFLVEAPAANGIAGDRLGVVAVVAAPGAASEDADEPLSGAERLVRALVAPGKLAHTLPLYVIGVDRGSDVAAVLPWCQRMRASLVLGGAAERREVLSVSRTVLERGQGAMEVAVVPCPGYRPGAGMPGLTRASIDVVKGQAAISFRADLGSDRSPRPILVTRRLVSASRVSSSEQRLHQRVATLIADARQRAAPTDGARIEAFGERARAWWERTGYASLCDLDGGDADGATSRGTVPLPPERDTRYNLLLLLRERVDGGGYDMLLSNHSPLRPSPLSDWNALLMPAFRSARDLLEHLRDDVVRQVTERAEDFERADHAKQFEEAVNTILLHGAGPGEELWADELREVATRTIVKISPTTGAVTRFDYRLVTLLPLIDRGNATPADTPEQPDGDGSTLAEELWIARRRIVSWLEQLDAVRLAQDGRGTASGLWLDALVDGAALRWDPAVMLVDDPDSVQRRQAVRAYPGAIWFPLDLDAPHWKRCPAIVSRNADVMTWVDGQLNAKRLPDGRFPDHLVLGRAASGPGAYEIEQTFPFASEGAPEPDPRDDDRPPARSTVDALALVRFSDAYDLGDRLAYADAEFKRVWLVRMPYPEHEHRNGIFLFEATDDGQPPQAPDARHALGMLRPVQRYVLRAGLERAVEIQQAVGAHLGEDGDRWGFVRVRKGAAPRRVSVTPPIVERLHSDDWDDGGIGEDFVVCDGNHRIVQQAWLDRQPTPAVAVVPHGDDLPEPYYARPFGRLEWDATADNELTITPELASKYLTRRVNADDELRRALAGVPARDYYRRYFRDLERGFGYLGGQGGKFE